jgi:hypothetical protein
MFALCVYPYKNTVFHIKHVTLLQVLDMDELIIETFAVSYSQDGVT